MGSSHDPGQDWTTMLDSLTPHSSSLAFAPSTMGSMTVEFQRAWTMPMRSDEPSCCWGVGPLREDMIAVFWSVVLRRNKMSQGKGRVLRSL